ncbi:hypothetical protein EJ03DRAFT_330854 [Teratosphaeria nubilosa]|uniref:Uncharacterized protein n=1 Tax=Teratosphaeria nubilosa TaxID=161662 RepID=A0A6G1KZ41_9PEZI|nr:hypothetical protein EJ03DRAFT_330854 [Teratosphaeria nubilosa]
MANQKQPSGMSSPSQPRQTTQKMMTPAPAPNSNRNSKTTSLTTPEHEPNPTPTTIHIPQLTQLQFLHSILIGDQNSSTELYASWTIAQQRKRLDELRALLQQDQRARASSAGQRPRGVFHPETYKWRRPRKRVERSRGNGGLEGGVRI